MSLLMDALKRAEEAKRQQGAQGTGDAPAPAAAPELALEPAGEVAARRPVLPDLDSHRDSVDAELQAAADENTTKPKSKAALAAAESARRQAAQNVFAAKEETPPPASATKRIVIIASMGLFAAAGIGSYFYWQLQSISGAGNQLAVKAGNVPTQRVIAAPVLPQIPSVAAPATEPAPTAVATAPATLAPAASRTPSPAAAEPPPAVPGTAPPAKVAAKTPAAKVASAPTQAPADSAAVAPKARAAVPRKASADTPRAPASPDALTVSAQSHDSLTVTAFESLQAGRLDVARSQYQQALRADRRNADALVGLATIAQREGDAEAAERYYQMAIDADPRNATAHAALIGLRGASDPVGSESRLKNLINSQISDPGAAGTLHFALGNLYAGQRRWNDAQQAYFRAHTSDAEHPDYLYNLAVSLDHLGQAGLAKQFYGRAIKATEKRPAAFDKAQGERRLAELQR